MLLERRGSHFVLTLFYEDEGYYGTIPHQPLVAPGSVAAEVRGAPMTIDCW